MRRLRYFFAAILLLFALPAWRLLDWVVVTSPFHFPVIFALVLWFVFFLGVPAKLIWKNFKTYALLLIIAGFTLLSYFTSPLSSMASNNPEYNHCGPLTYTGTFYPLRNILAESHRDDLEARNQLCWIRKLISKVPQKFDSLAEVESYSNLIRNKLLKPEIKFRAGLPLIAVLYFKINTSGAEYIGVKAIYDSLHFWIDHYTEEISKRDYSLWNWPFSEYIKLEYGLIERNWQELIDSIVIQETR